MSDPILVWGTCDLGKPRTRILLKALAANGAPVHYCHHHLWAGVEDKTRMKSPLTKLFLLIKAAVLYPWLLLRYLFAPKHAVVFIGYPGPWEVILLYPLARLRGVPIVWDVFISLYDTVVRDRAMRSPKHPVARLLFQMERLAGRLASRFILDTATHRDAFCRLYGLDPAKGGRVFVGAETDVFQPLSLKPQEPVMQVLFYGQCIPLHGMQTIVEAAAQAGPGWRWVLIGSGQEEAKIRTWLTDHPVDALTWLPWVPYNELREQLAQADIVLGIFGTSAKAANVIPNKAFQTLSCDKPLLTMDSPAIRELVSPQDPGIYLVPPGDPKALLAALETFRMDRPHLTAPLHDKHREAFTDQSLAAQWLTMLHD